MKVPQLGRKLKLLVSYGVYPSLGAIAGNLARSPVTLRGWANGGHGQPPDSVPQRAASAVIDLFAEALPNLTPAQIRELLGGPADDLEALLAAKSPVSIMELIKREGDASSGTVEFEPGDFMGLVRTRVREGSPHYRIRLGHAFRIQFRTNSRVRFVAALQSAPGGWGVVPCTLEVGAGRVHLPGLGEEDQLEYMAEDNEVGTHLFVALQGNQPLPAELAAAERDGGSLDRTLLAHIVRNFESQNKSSRRLFMMEIEMVASG